MTRSSASVLDYGALALAEQDFGNKREGLGGTRRDDDLLRLALDATRSIQVTADDLSQLEAAFRTSVAKGG